MQRNPNPNNLPVELNRTSLYLGLLFVFVTGVLMSSYFSTEVRPMSGKKSPSPMVEFLTAFLMAVLQCPGAPAGPKAFCPLACGHSRWYGCFVCGRPVLLWLLYRRRFRLIFRLRLIVQPAFGPVFLWPPLLLWPRFRVRPRKSTGTTLRTAPHQLQSPLRA